jgi:heavy metal sensor kinase
MPIRVRLTIWYAAVLTAIILVLAGFLVWRLRADLVHGLDTSLDVRAQQTAVALEDPEDTHEELDLEVFRLSSRLAPPAGAVTQVVSTDGELVASIGDGLDAPLVDADLARDAPGGERVLRATASADGSGDYRIHVAPLTRTDNVLVVANAMAPVDETTRRLLVLLAIALPVAIGASVALGYVLARRALAPIDRMTKDAAAIGADDASARLDLPPTDDEVGRLGRTLNGMLERLHGAITEQKRFTADASHELRTPLAVMQSEIDVALRSSETSPEARRVLTSMREEVVRMTRLVESLLVLMRADEGRLELAAGEVDIGDVARIVRNRLEPAAREKGTTITVEAEPLVVWGDSDRLDQLLTNLVDNAVKYSPDGGEVRVVVRSDDGSAVVEVSDTGPGIPAADIEHVFDRFYRVDKSRTRTAGGAGLGLAICRSIVEAHHGRIDVSSVEGRGAVFTVRLPRRP